MTSRRELGNKGEEATCTFLMKQGYRIVCRNYWRKWGEIDIVATKEGILYFVEVKTVSRDLSVTRETGDRYRAEDNLHEMKLRRLSRVIQTYLFSERIPHEQVWKFHIAIVLMDHFRAMSRVELLEDIIL